MNVNFANWIKVICLFLLIFLQGCKQPTKSSNIFSKAEMSAKSGDYAKALSLYSEIAKNNPGTDLESKSYLEIGNIYIGEDNYEIAKSFFDKVSGEKYKTVARESIKICEAKIEEQLINKLERIVYDIMPNLIVPNTFTPEHIKNKIIEVKANKLDNGLFNIKIKINEDFPLFKKVFNEFVDSNDISEMLRSSIIRIYISAFGYGFGQYYGGAEVGAMQPSGVSLDYKNRINELVLECYKREISNAQYDKYGNMQQKENINYKLKGIITLKKGASAKFNWDDITLKNINSAFLANEISINVAFQIKSTN